MNEHSFNDNIETDNYYEEEEGNSDLESRLYANIHYASVENEAHNETLDITRIHSTNETRNTSDKEVSNNNDQNVTSTHKGTESIENAGHDLYQSVQQNKDMINNEVNKTHNNNKDPYTFDANVEDQSAALPVKSKRKRKRKSHAAHNDIYQQFLNLISNSPNPLPVAPQVIGNSKNQSKDLSISNVTNASKKCTESAKKKQDTENVFMKYQKSKQTLNKAYTEKQKEIEGMNSKYDVLEKKEKEKLQDIEHSSNANYVDNDSDSDQSILEIPVPSKPQPLIINLNDSDEDIECTDNILPKQQLTVDSCNTADFRNQVKRALSRSQSELTSINNSRTSNDVNAVEDIILNCTNIQKGASSINEIREMSTDVRRKKKSQTTKQKDSDILQESINIDNNKNKSKKKKADKRNLNRGTTKETETCLANKSIDYTEDVFPADAFIRSQNELHANKKRQLEQQQQGNDKSKRKKNNSEPYQSKASTSSKHNEVQEITHKSTDNSFFRPMSKQLKTFYTDSRGQESFDVNEVQSQMSKDPQLWAILDEDLRPNTKKQRFWNVKCGHCQQYGHQRHNCPEPRRPPKCYMCGVEGHTEIRCPQKMCLTCGKRQGTFRKTCETCRTFYCTMCNAVGHKSTECPDLWRRYHQTTTTDNVSIPDNKGAMKPANLLFCCNCTKRGHDFSMCKDYRWSQHFPTPPFVSNYTDGPTYMEEQTTNMDVLSDVQVVQFHDSTNDGVTVKSSNDLLPFPKELLKKTHSKKKAFPQHIPQLAWENERNIAYIIYHCGDFYTLENNGVEITYTITARKGFNTYNIMECHVVPNFLENLLELFRFEVKIYKEIGRANEIILRIRTFANVINDLCRLILYWLSLEDDEKDYVIFLNLPMQRTAMLNILHTQIIKLGTESGNAAEMYDAIFTLKFDLQNARDQQYYDIVFGRLQEIQHKLLLILNDHPHLQKISEEMWNLVKFLEQSTSEDIPLQQFLQILTVYNYLFIPHTPPKSFVTKYGKKPKLLITEPRSTPRSTLRCNPDITVPIVQTKVQGNSTIPVIITNRTTHSNVDVNPFHEDFSNMSNVNKQTYMPPPQTAASSTNIRVENQNNTSENYRISERNDPSGADMDENEGFRDDFILNRKIVQYDTVSASHDFLPIDTASEKYTNITVNVSNKNHTGIKSPTSNTDNSKNDKCQNANKYTNITVSVSNKGQDHTSTSFQSNMNNSKNNKHQNSKKYTNITVSVSDKNQTHTAVSNISDLNKPKIYNLRSNDTRNSRNNESVDNDVVCIEIKKKVPDCKEKKQTQNTDKQQKVLTLAQQKKQMEKQKKRAMKVRLKLKEAYGTINKNIRKCSSENKKDWIDFANQIMIPVSQCFIPYLRKEIKKWKTRIRNNILSKDDALMIQRLVRIELQHRNEINKLYDSFDQSTNNNNAQNKDNIQV